MVLTTTSISTDPDRQHVRKSRALSDYDLSLLVRLYRGSIISCTILPMYSRSSIACDCIEVSSVSCSNCCRSRAEKN
jgi:hypothetical protein